MRDFSRPSSQKTRIHDHGSTMRGGKLMPVAALPLPPSDSGTSQVQLSVELEPINGRLYSDILLEVFAVYVPVLGAFSKAWEDYPEAVGDNAYIPELMRRRFDAGEDIFPLATPCEIDDRCGIEPTVIDGNLMVSSIIRHSHNAAVDFLRRRIYHKAEKVDALNVGITPALFSSTALDIYNAVLNPEERINGAVSLTGDLPVHGVGIIANGTSWVTQTDSQVVETGSATSPSSRSPVSREGWRIVSERLSAPADGEAKMFIEADGQTPNIRAVFGEGNTLSLKEFMIAERQHDMVKIFDQMRRANPQLGDEMVSRYVHSLQMETGHVPYMVYQKTDTFASFMQRATDGPNLDVERTNNSALIDFSAVTPKNEFGGVIMVFASVKPQEVILKQPDPIFTQSWLPKNNAADSLVIDPVPVIRRQLDSDCPLENENDVMFYVGNNHMERSYARLDFSRDVDTSELDHKYAYWRVEIPNSVTADNIIYDDTLPTGPFGIDVNTTDIASYNVKALQRISSPTIMGPTPIEDVEAIDSDDIFEEADE